MAKSAKLNRFLIIAGCLIGVQALLTFYFKGTGPKPVQESINEALQSKQYPPRKREQLRLQLTVRHFQSEKEKLPQNLTELVPVYIDRIPIDPNTGQPFSYRVADKKFYIGEAGEETPTTPEGETQISEESQKELIASLTNPEAEAPFVYDPTNKRDPFMPFNLAPPPNGDDTLTELQKFALGQLKLKAVLLGLDEPKALVENAAGKGFYVKKGTLIGNENGVVVDIVTDKIIIVEESTDFAGNTKSRKVEMTLRSKDQKEDRLSRSPALRDGSSKPPKRK